MNTATAVCRKCQSEARVESLPGVAGDEGGVRVNFPALPALVCARGHRRFVMPGFPAGVLERLSAGLQLPAGKAKGLLVKRYYCGACDAALDRGATADRTYGVDVDVKETGPVRVELTVPVLACPACGREQVASPDEIAKLVPAAMARAFQSAEIPPG